MTAQPSLAIILEKLGGADAANLVIQQAGLADHVFYRDPHYSIYFRVHNKKLLENSQNTQGWEQSDFTDLNEASMCLKPSFLLLKIEQIRQALEIFNTNNSSDILNVHS